MFTCHMPLECLHVNMLSDVDKLRDFLNASSDSALAAMLGVGRSTVSQWRRREQLPARYLGLIQAPSSEDIKNRIRRSDRRSVYGDGNGRYVLSAALAFIPLHSLDFGEQLSPGNIGWARESRIIYVVQAVLRVCQQIFGKQRCESHDEYIRLMRALETEEAQGWIAFALCQAAIGELPD